MKNFFTSTTIGVQLFFILMIFCSLFYIVHYGIRLSDFLLVILGYFVYGCIGIVVTFHRYLTHQSFTANGILLKFFSVLGCLAGTGSSIAWVAIHINHHLRSDKITDPHSPLHKGWRIFLLNYQTHIDSGTKWKMRHIITDKFHQLLHRYYFLIFIVYSILLFLIGGIYAVIIFHWLPSLFTIIMSNIVNYVGHKPNWLGGYRHHNISDQSTNNWIWALPSWGEAWHNNHHRYPKRWYFGDKWYEFDISGHIINLIRNDKT